MTTKIHTSRESNLLDGNVNERIKQKVLLCALNIRVALVTTKIHTSRESNLLDGNVNERINGYWIV